MSPMIATGGILNNLLWWKVVGLFLFNFFKYNYKLTKGVAGDRV